MAQILLIEDEEKTARSIRQGLEEHRFSVDVAYDGTLGKRMAGKGEYELIVCDIILPGLNGLDLCRQLRQEGIETPVLMLTALGTVDDTVEGLEAGADDYLTKPFEFKELLARVRAMLKRSSRKGSVTPVLRVSDLELNLDMKTAMRAGKRIELTAREFALLEFFIRNNGRTLSKTAIAEHVWGIHFDTGTNVVEVYVNYLRKKIDRDFTPKLIHTQFGMGYILKEE